MCYIKLILLTLLMSLVSPQAWGKSLPPVGKRVYVIEGQSKNDISIVDGNHGDDDASVLRDPIPVGGVKQVSETLNHKQPESDQPKARGSYDLRRNSDAKMVIRGRDREPSWSDSSKPEVKPRQEVESSPVKTTENSGKSQDFSKMLDKEQLEKLIKLCNCPPGVAIEALKQKQALGRGSSSKENASKKSKLNFTSLAVRGRSATPRIRFTIDPIDIGRADQSIGLPYLLNLKRQTTAQEVLVRKDPPASN